MNIPQRWIIFSAVLILLAACSPVATDAPPTETPESISTTTPSPSHTAPAAAATHTRKPAPSWTAAPEPTDIPPLPPEGPYFAFINQKGDAFTLTFIGADGIGRRDVPLPEGADAGNGYSGLISPDGEWLAYWTGFAGEPFYKGLPASDGPFDLQLNLLHIPDGETTKVTDLLAPDYPANFEKNAEAVKGLPIFEGEDIPSIAGYLRESFLAGIKSAAWSPNGRYLAFAGEMDGPSSDLYVYDIGKNAVLRLSSGPKNISPNHEPNIYWSSGGKWIVYSSTYIGISLTFYAARPDGNQFWDFPDEVESWLGWGSSTNFLVSQGEMGMGRFGLRTANLDTGVMTTIWRCPYEGFSYDPEGRVLVFMMGGFDGTGCEIPGLYLQNITSGYSKLLAGQEGLPYIPQTIFLGQGDRRFLVYMYQTGTYAVTSSGKMELINNDDLFPFVAPNHEWVAFVGDGLRIMDYSGNFTEHLSHTEFEKAFWRPDSEGFLLTSGKDVFVYSLLEEKLIQLDGFQFPPDVEDIYWQPDSEGFFFTDDSDLFFLSLLDFSLHQMPVKISRFSFDPVWVSITE
jgi:hypothetical protein